MEPFWAAVVFIDISGFSSLASELQAGEEGEGIFFFEGGGSCREREIKQPYAAQSS